MREITTAARPWCAGAASRAPARPRPLTGQRVADAIRLSALARIPG